MALFERGLGGSGGFGRSFFAILCVLCAFLETRIVNSFSVKKDFSRKARGGRKGQTNLAYLCDPGELLRNCRTRVAGDGIKPPARAGGRAPNPRKLASASDRWKINE